MGSGQVCALVLTVERFIDRVGEGVSMKSYSLYQKERTWFAAGQQIATYFRENPDARHEIDFEREEVAGNNFSLSLSSHERWST
jgi:hypothetical protein